MTMKAFGKDIKAFYDSIPEGYIHDGEEPDYGLEEGEDISDLEDGKKYDLSKWGYICKEEGAPSEVKFETMFKKWKAQQTHTSVLLSIDKEQLAIALATIKTIKGVTVIR
jgi:hypothetical protein